MPKLRANNIELAYELHGCAADPILVLIQGLGMPLTAWPPMLIDQFIEHGFRVLLFDNRDIGQSQSLDTEIPKMAWQLIKRKMHLPVKAPYQLTDMMDDTDRLMDALDIDSAHIVGISMGGMIAQLLAIHKPARVTSLVSLMSTTGNRRLPGPTREVARHLMSRPVSGSTEDRMAFGRKTWQLIGSPGYPTSEDNVKQTLSRIYTRGSTPAGIARQMLAIMAASSRVKALKTIDTPTLVIHGDADPLVPVECGIDTARVIPGTRLEVIPGLGHDLPAQLLAKLSGMIADHARQSEQAETERAAPPLSLSVGAKE